MTDQISTREAAERLGYTVQHIRRLIRGGHLHAAKVGRDWVVEDKSVERFLSMRQNVSLVFPEDKLPQRDEVSS